MDDDKLRELAGWYCERLGKSTKPMTRVGITIIRDDIPEAEQEKVKELVHAAHGNMFPDDWRYEAIKYVLGGLEDEGEDFQPEADIYTSDLTAWLGSRADRMGYCDDAAEEYGANPDKGLCGMIQLGQVREYEEIKGAILAHLEEIADAEEDATDEDEPAHPAMVTSYDERE